MNRLLKPVIGSYVFLKKRWKLIGVLLVIVGGFGLLRYRSIQAHKPTLKFDHPAYRDIAKTLQVSGVIDAKEKASLRFAAGGKVVYLGAKEGDLVRKGQTLATIDQRDLKKRLQQDLNDYMSERINRDQNLDHESVRTFPKDELNGVDKEQLTLENTVLDVEIRTIAIQNTVLSAPFSGVLTRSPATVPGVVLLSTDTFDVVNPATLVFRAAVDEADISQVSLGQQGNIKLDAYPDQKIPTAVSYIDVKSSQSSTGTVFIVEFPLTNDPELHKYKLGMNGDVDIILDQRQNVLTVPLDATRERDGKMYVDVRINSDSKGKPVIAEREIKPGLQTDDYVEVLDGLTQHDEIVIPES